MNTKVEEALGLLRGVQLLVGIVDAVDTIAQHIAQQDATIARMREAIEEMLYSHPVASTYPDGPCIERETRQELQAIIKEISP